MIHRVQAHLSTLKGSELKSLALSCGVTLTGTKATLVNRLGTHFEQLLHLGKPTTTTTTTKNIVLDVDRLLPSSVLSFDMGYRNLAFVQVSKERHIKAWQVVDLALENFHPSSMAPVVRQFVYDNIRPLSPLEHILIEQQRARSNGSHGIFEHTLRVNTVEALLWCSLQECLTTTTMEPILRRPVDQLWQDGLESLWSTNNGSEKKMNKKHASILLVQHWLDQQTVSCPDDLAHMFRLAKKKDDLSDCLMQALAWYQWRENAINYLTSLQ
ncbi:ribonuclease H-like domain-containing protein [Halteromyces radiatus]|uniref:ribonuclease H-like domain-containing protein n=1 Tax=Halteromyces radiatus TaxID=101107 RepID=UPI00222073A1|nr:ribonuclease H-like domain-containing protein [Halteromyces radiatus]KAI8092930.1 ribonuclease H-like domain-containing protein [Halteromyces radiatus]